MTEKNVRSGRRALIWCCLTLFYRQLSHPTGPIGYTATILERLVCYLIDTANDISFLIKAHKQPGAGPASPSPSASPYRDGYDLPGGRYVLLTDIFGLGDHAGDMDFKAPGQIQRASRCARAAVGPSQGAPPPRALSWTASIDPTPLLHFVFNVY
jgi:hypothetical protein